MTFVVQPSRNKMLSAAWAGYKAEQRKASKKPEGTEVAAPPAKAVKAKPVSKPKPKAPAKKRKVAKK